MTPALFAQLFRTSHGALHLNLAGVTPEEALLQPEPAGNCLTWIVGHITASRNGALRVLGEEPIWDAETAKRYARSSAPILGSGDGLPFERIVADFDATQERIVAALARTSPEDLARTWKDDQSVGAWLAFLHFHESYHVGQTGIVRRLIGKEGAIR
ncbi:MAG: DinB family protein [Hyphomicrobiales bacterium]